MKVTAAAAASGDKVEMPSFNIRHSIATKVAAKKTSKGYTLSAERCDLCKMPLMTLQGNSSCKVCPAIKKWLERKNEGSGQEQGVNDKCDVEESTTVVAEIRDEAPVDPIGKYGKSDINRSEPDDLSKAETTDSDDTDVIRERARQIVMNAKSRVALTSSDDDDSTMASAQGSWDYNASPSWDDEINTSESMRDKLVRDRAEQIINRARKNLQAERKAWCDDSPPESVSTFNIHYKKSASFNEVDTAVSEEADPDMISSMAVQAASKEETRVDDTTGEAKFESLGISNSHDEIEVDGVDDSKKQENKGDAQEQEKADDAQARDNKDGSQVVAAQDFSQDFDSADEPESLLSPTAYVTLTTPDAAQDDVQDDAQDVAKDVSQAAEFLDVSQDTPAQSLDETATDALISEEQDGIFEIKSPTTHDAEFSEDQGGVLSPDSITDNATSAKEQGPSITEENTIEMQHTDKTKPRGIIAGITAAFQSLVSCNIDDIVSDVTLEDDFAHEPRQYRPRSKYDTPQCREKVTYEVAETYHLSVIAVKSEDELETVASQSHEPEPTKSFLPQYLEEPAAHLDMQWLATPQAFGNGAHYVPTMMFTQQSDAHQNEMHLPKMPPMPMATNTTLNFSPSSPSSLQVKEAKDFLVSKNTPVGAQGDDVKENVHKDANASERLDDAMLRVKEAKMFLMSRNYNRLITPNSQTSTQLLVNGMAPDAQSPSFMPQMILSTQGYHTDSCFSRQGSTAPGAKENTSMHQSNVIAYPPGAKACVARPFQSVITSASPKMLRSMGSLMSPEAANNAHHADETVSLPPGSQRSPQMCASNMTANSGYRTPQMPAKYFFA